MGKSKKRNRRRSKIQAPKPTQDFEFISNDPDENRDNFHPKWTELKELATDEERYNLVRERWGNDGVPDPEINLTYRHETTEGVSDGKASCLSTMLLQKNKRPKTVSDCRSRSCTWPFEKQISNLKEQYGLEYRMLQYKQNNDLYQLLHIQKMQLMYYSNTLNFVEIRTALFNQQEEEIRQLLSRHFEQARCLMMKKQESINNCKKIINEVKTFFAFYQKINNNEVTLQMSKERHEHTVETEKMYKLYDKFYT